MDSNKCNKIREVVRLQQIIKKWKKVAAAASNNRTASSSSNCTSNSSGSSKGIKFLKRTLSFTDVSNSNNNEVVPKGFLAVCVGKELKRFIIPMDYLRHQAFEELLRQAEEEFGFQQEGVLKIPCQVSLFQQILKAVQDNKESDKDNNVTSQVTPPHHAQLCT